MKKGDIIDVELTYITSDNKGVGWTDEGKLILVDQVDDDDSVVKVSVTKVLFQTILCKKKSRMVKETRNIEPEEQQKNPYEIDDLEDDEEDLDDTSFLEGDEDED